MRRRRRAKGVLPAVSTHSPLRFPLQSSRMDREGGGLKGEPLSISAALLLVRQTKMQSEAERSMKGLHRAS